MATNQDKEERDARRGDVLEYMKTMGPFSLPAKALGEKHNCTSKTILRDRDYWLRQIKFKDISLEGKKILMSLMKNMSITEELKATGNPGDRIRAIMASNSTAEVFNKILESFGFKEKVADRLDIEGQVPIEINIIKPNNEEGNKKKSDKLPSDRKAGPGLKLPKR